MTKLSLEEYLKYKLIYKVFTPVAVTLIFCLYLIFITTNYFGTFKVENDTKQILTQIEVAFLKAFTKTHFYSENRHLNDPLLNDTPFDFKNNSTAKIASYFDADLYFFKNEFFISYKKNNTVVYKKLETKFLNDHKKILIIPIGNTDHDFFKQNKKIFDSRKQKAFVKKNSKNYYANIIYGWDLTSNLAVVQLNPVKKIFMSFAKITGLFCILLFISILIFTKLHKRLTSDIKKSVNTVKNLLNTLSQPSDIKPHYEPEENFLIYEFNEINILIKKLLEEHKISCDARLDINKSAIDIKDNIFKYSLDLFSVMDFKGNMQSLNASWESLTGWDIKELTIKPIHNFIHFDDINIFENAFNSILSHTHTGSIEIRFICKNGKFIWVELNFYPDYKKEIIFSIAKDINSKKVYEEQIKENENINFALLNATSEIALLIETDGTIIGANNIAAQKFGKDINELKGKILYNFLCEELKHLALGISDYVIKTAQPTKVEDEQKNIIYEYSVYPVLNKHNLVDKIAVYAQDITIKKHAEENLKKSEQHFKALFEAIPIPSYTLKKEEDKFIFQTVNKAALVYSKNTFIENKTYEAFPELTEDLNACFNLKENIRKEIKLFLPEYENERYFDASYVFIPNDHVLIMAEDITRRKEFENEIKKLSLALEQSPSAVFITDHKGFIEYTNNRFTEIYEFEKDKAIGQTAAIIKTDKTSPQIYDRLQDCIKNKTSWKGEIHRISKSEKQYWMNITISPVTNNMEQIISFLVISENITQKKIDEEKLRFMAITDELTKLPNRRFFVDKAKEEIAKNLRYNRPLTLMMIDIDHFKAINDTFGHNTGDKVLISLSDIIRSSIRETDIPGRLGGEEFAIILSETTLQNGFTAAEKIRKKVMNSPYEANNQQISYTISIGLASLDSSDFTDQTNLIKKDKDEIKKDILETLLKKADICLYESKRTGRNKTSVSLI